MLQGSESPHLVANAAFLAEKAAREAAEQKLATLRRTLTHKEQLLKDVRAKVRVLRRASVLILLCPTCSAGAGWLAKLWQDYTV